MFVKTMRGEYYPVSSIETMWVGKSEKGTKVDKASIRDVGEVTLFYGEVERVVDATSQTLPGTPNTYALIEVMEDDNTYTLEKTPVLGWLLTAERGVVPVTIEGINNGHDRTVPVLMPTGEVVLAENTTYSNESSYLEALNGGKETI